MADELDQRLRGAMKTLDAELPSGYFETLPERLIARLSGEEGTMQQPSGTPNREASSPNTAPPLELAPPQEEDSGLHDIRSLAQSTKQRLSKKIPTVQPMSDDDVLASSSASWKNLALPQPAAMVSLPAIEDLPSKQAVAATAKASKPTKGLSASAVEASASASMSGRVEYQPAFSTSTRPVGKSNKTRTIALIGVGLAAAAGITIFVATQKSNEAAQPVVAQASAPASAAERGGAAETTLAKPQARAEAAPAVVTATPIEPPADRDIGGGGFATGAAGDGKPDAAKIVTKTPAPAPKAAHGGKSKNVETATVEKPQQQTKTGKGAPASGAAEGEDKDFNALLQEAGVNDKKPAKPKLDKKDLTPDDFKNGMQAIKAKAQACYKGTQGSANVKLTIAPSGTVSKVAVSGTFAGKPEADCVTAAVKSASFPAWDGSPQSFGYPILLSE